MHFKIFSTYEEASTFAATELEAVIRSKPDAVLGLATGSTPEGLYEEMALRHAQGGLDFSQVRTVNLDEYVGLEGTHPQSYRYFMEEKLFSKVNIRRENTHVPQGTAQDLEAAVKGYEALLKSMGAPELQVLGIGANGHIGFNEPGTELEMWSHVADLTEETIEANARFFQTRDEVPRQAISMGIGSIFRAKRILLMAFGESKAQAIKALENSKIDTAIPATLLKLHPNVTIVLDVEAAKLLEL